MQRSDFLLVVSDERYLSVAKVPSSHSASRARRDCAGPQAGFGSRMRLSLSSFVEPHFLHARVRSSNFQLNRIGLIRRMTISVPQLGHADDASASGGVSGTAT